MDVKIRSGKYSVFDSGTVISFEKEPLTFVVSDLTINVIFLTDSQNHENKMLFSAVNNKELNMTLVNFNNSLGAGNAEPLLLGSVGNQNLYLNYTIYALNNESNKVFHYTWYLGEEVANG